MPGLPFLWQLGTLTSMVTAAFLRFVRWLGGLRQGGVVLIEAQGRLGGKLLKIDLAEAAPLGRFQGWKAFYTLVQWSVVR